MLPLLLALVIGLADAAVAAPPANDPAPTGAPLVIYHWWTSPAEIGALDALSRVFQARHPGIPEKRMTTPDRGASLFTTLQNLAGVRRSPDAVFMQTGYYLRPFIDAGLLAPLDGLWAAEGWESVTPKALHSMLRFDGHYYSVPLDVHRANLIWYNKHVLDRNGIDPATLTSWDRLFAAADRLRASGTQVPFQVAASWTLSHVFGSIIASQGLATYEDWLNGKLRTATDPRLLGGLTTLKRLLGYANSDHAGLDWTVAHGRVAKGESAFCQLGDWAGADFSAAGLVYGRDYGAVPVPGTKALYLVTIDSFVQPRGLAQPQTSEAWLKIVGSREGQDAFNPGKGSIPVRVDANPARYGPYQRSAIAAFKTAHICPSYGAGLPPVYVRTLAATLETLAADGDVAKAAAALAAETDRSSASFTRVWALD
jgi:glucose/mannose transport system substrate-binding protein